MSEETGVVNTTGVVAIASTVVAGILGGFAFIGKWLTRQVEASQKAIDDNNQRHQLMITESRLVTAKSMTALEKTVLVHDYTISSLATTDSQEEKCRLANEKYDRMIADCDGRSAEINQALTAVKTAATALANQKGS